MTASERAAALAARVELAVFDVDGVMTDGRIVVDSHGEELKHFNVRDGLGLVLLQRAGIAVAVITGRESGAVKHRMAELGIKHVFQGQSNKLVALRTLLETVNVGPEQVLYAGDDLPDLAVMRRVGVPVAVADADPAVRAQAVHVTRATGGHGAVREICDLVLRARGLYDDLLGEFAADGG